MENDLQIKFNTSKEAVHAALCGIISILFLDRLTK